MVEDLKDMIRADKKWSTEIVDEKVKQFKTNKRRKLSADASLTMSMDDIDSSKKSMLEKEEESEDLEEFEAKRAKDAENKIIQDIFGGKVRLILDRKTR